MKANKIRSICIVGAGTMGSQIALQCAVNGYNVYLYDVSERALNNAKEKIRKFLDERVTRGEISSDSRRPILSRIDYTMGLEEAAKNADFVIEAVYEKLEVKRQVFSQLDRFCPPEIIIASNTSSIKSSAFAGATVRPERIVDINFSNPVWAHPMVEIMGNPRTSPETINTTKQLAESIGMTPILVRKEITGYAFNRIWRAIKKESLHLIDQGYVSFEDIDRAFMIGLGTSVGPFMLMDMIGLDVVKAIEEQYYRESGDESDKPPKILLEKVAKGDLGVKTDKGFYEYPNPSFKKPDWIKGDQSKKMHTEHKST